MANLAQNHARHGICATYHITSETGMTSSHHKTHRRNLTFKIEEDDTSRLQWELAGCRGGRGKYVSLLRTEFMAHGY
jgi:hypothetical protein